MFEEDLWRSRLRVAVLQIENGTVLVVVRIQLELTWMRLLMIDVGVS